MAGMGFLDDFIKVRKRHNRGIFWKQKNYVTLLLSFGIAWWLVAATGISETISLTRSGFPGWHVPAWAFVIWAGLIIWATTNAVNVTDGLDGLAGGIGADGLRRVHDHRLLACASTTRTSTRRVVNPLDLAVLAAAFAGACMGFLWFNAAPARIIMGDVGALGLGAALSLLALTTEHPIAAAVDLRHQRDGGRVGGACRWASSRRAGATSGCSACRRSTTTSS